MNGPCVVCGQGTDTALGFQGDANWVAAGLVVLGVPTEEAMDAVEDYWGGPDAVPPGEFVQAVQVCAECVAKCPADFPAPGVLMHGVQTVPVIRGLV